MAGFNVNRNVYDAVKAATYDGWTSSPQVSDGEAGTIEQAIAADGQVDTGEAQLLSAMRSGTSFRVTTAGQAPYDVNQSLLSFDKSKINPLPAGTRAAVDADNDLHAVPSTVPAQQTGRASDVYVDQNQTGGNASWQTARTRLLNPNNWEATADTQTTVDRSAGFQLTDASGSPVSRAPQVGDYLKIDLPGPSGYDWVKVEAISDKPNELSIRVRPSADPTSTSSETAHFFTDAATNTFTLRRDPQSGKLSFQVNGRNESSNGVRGSAINAGGALGMQDDQWSNLGAGILR